MKFLAAIRRKTLRPMRCRRMFSPLCLGEKSTVSVTVASRDGFFLGNMFLFCDVQVIE